jgi:transcriptional regulator with XRE-family HTH domain
MRRERITKEAIGRRLRELRIMRGLSPKQLVEGCDKLDVAAISMFEGGETLRRLHRHAPQLARKLGDEVYVLAFEVINLLVAQDVRDDFDRQVLQAIGELIREQMADTAAAEPARGEAWDKGRWGPFPSAQKLAERLGLVGEGEELDLLEASRLAESIQRLGLVRGWLSWDDTD